jgi:hypothetical protein
MRHSFPRVAFTAVVGLLMSGCGSGTGTPTPSPTPTPPAAAGMSITPAAVALYTNRTQTFVARSANATSPSVTWSIPEGVSGGTITSAGIYTAPTTAGTYHIVATSVADTTQTATAAVTIQAAPATLTLVISPVSATLSVGSSLTLAATVSFSSSQSVTWSVQEGTAGGTVTSGGVYTAPSTPGTYHVVATSVAAPTASGVSTITVQGGGSAVTVN